MSKERHSAALLQKISLVCIHWIVGINEIVTQSCVFVKYKLIDTSKYIFKLTPVCTCVKPYRTKRSIVITKLQSNKMCIFSCIVLVVYL